MDQSLLAEVFRLVVLFDGVLLGTVLVYVAVRLAREAWYGKN